METHYTVPGVIWIETETESNINQSENNNLYLEKD